MSDGHRPLSCGQKPVDLNTSIRSEFVNRPLSAAPPAVGASVHWELVMVIGDLIGDW